MLLVRPEKRWLPLSLLNLELTNYKKWVLLKGTLPEVLKLIWPVCIVRVRFLQYVKYVTCLSALKHPEDWVRYDKNERFIDPFVYFLLMRNVNFNLHANMIICLFSIVYFFACSNFSLIKCWGYLKISGIKFSFKNKPKL